MRVGAFHIDIMDASGTWKTIAEETTIGYKRIVLTEKVTASRVRIVIDQMRAQPILNHIGLYLDNITEIEP